MLYKKIVLAFFSIVFGFYTLGSLTTGSLDVSQWPNGLSAILFLILTPGIFILITIILCDQYYYERDKKV